MASADGSIVKAALPAGVEGSHVGPDLRALIHGLYASGMTQPALFEFVCSVGIQISEGQIHNILMGEAEGYAKHSEAILSAGLQEAPYINLSFGFFCPLEQRESSRRANIIVGSILSNMNPMMILAIRGFDAVQRAKKPKTQVILGQMILELGIKIKEATAGTLAGNILPITKRLPQNFD